MVEKVRRADLRKTGEFVLWWSCLEQVPVNGSVRA